MENKKQRKERGKKIKYANIKFTVEFAEKNMMSFLDTMLFQRKIKRYSRDYGS